MLIFTYFILMVLFVGALIFRKKIMDATIGSIHKGALTLNNRVEEWGNKQITENPSSPVAMLRYAKQWKRAEARREIYQKLREGMYGQKKEQKKSAPGDAGASPTDDLKKAGASGDPPEGVAYRQSNHTRDEKPKTTGPKEPTENVQIPVEGLEQVPEKARESFGWRPAPDGQTGSQGEEGLEVFGPWDKIPHEAREPVKYDVVMEDGKKQTVYGSWENTPQGPVLRENYWSLERTKRAYRILRDKEGKVFARNIGVNDATEKRRQADQKTTPQAKQNNRPIDYSPPEAAPGPQPGANHASARGATKKSTQRGRGPVDFGARYSPGTHPPRESAEKTVNGTGFVKDEKTDVQTAGPNFRVKGDIANPGRHRDQPPVINEGGDGSGAGTG